MPFQLALVLQVLQVQCLSFWHEQLGAISLKKQCSVYVAGDNM